jgi:hypothetical protein
MEAALAKETGPTLIAGHIVLHATLVERETRVSFDVSLKRPDGIFSGEAYRIWFGPVTLMTIRVPADRAPDEISFGPTFLDVAQCAALKSFDFVVTREGEPIDRGVRLKHLAGDVALAVSIADEPGFHARIQLHHSRYASKVLITLGARAAYHRFDSFTIRAAALTILAHRVLEKDFASLDAADDANIRWLVSQALPMTLEGMKRITGEQKPRWEEVRWTLSLATVGANLSLLIDDVAQARELFGMAASQTDKVWIARVSALNLVNACFFHGLLSLIAGDEAEAKTSFMTGVSSYPTMVSAQDMMENVWVVGDLINIARTSRQCFIALARFGLIKPKDQPLIDDTNVIDIAQIQSPVGNIAGAGRAPTLVTGLGMLKRLGQSRKHG